MKKVFPLVLLLTTLTYCMKAQNSQGEKTFNEKADKCLEIIEKAAEKKSIKGVAIIAYIPGESTESWVSKMKVVGNLTKDQLNLLGIAYAKAAEMATTYKDSGSGTRDKMIGEVGWQGGAIRKVSSGYILAAFSGGESMEDLNVSNQGLDWLSTFYK